MSSRFLLITARPYGDAGTTYDPENFRSQDMPGACRTSPDSRLFLLGISRRPNHPFARDARVKLIEQHAHPRLRLVDKPNDDGFVEAVACCTNKFHWMDCRTCRVKLRDELLDNLVDRVDDAGRFYM